MPRPRNPIPKPRRHKNAAVLDVYDGKTRRTITLGPWGSDRAAAEYQRFLARLRPAIPTSPPSTVPHPPDVTVSELILAYIKRQPPKAPDRRPGGTDPVFSLRALHKLFGDLPAAEFGPRALKALRDHWVAEGLSRKVVNGRVGAVRRLFKFATAEEMIEVGVYQRLQAVEGLRANQTDAPDRPPVRPAVMADVEKALPFMPPAARAVVLIQIYSAARAGELVRLKVGDIDRTDPNVWVYRPGGHKTAWKGKGRVVYFGRRCQEVLEPLLAKAGGPDAYVFSPRRAEAERNAERSVKRKTPRWASHMRRNVEKRKGAARKRPPGLCYSTGTYRQAVERACEKAGVPRFTPHRIRHLAATRARAELGVDVARALCGHTLASVTEVYSREVDRQLALRAVKKFG